MLWWRRILSTVLALWVIISVSFACLYCLPGDPARIILGPQASAEAIVKFRHTAGLDLPLHDQYLRYLHQLTRLDLGYSFSMRRSVATLLRERGGMTLKLTLAATSLVVLYGVALPIVLRLFDRKWLADLYEGLLQLGALTPPYVLAVIGLLLFGGWLGWIRVVFDASRIIDWVIPAMALSAYPTGLIMRIFVGQLEEELHSSYACRARALGMPFSYIVLHEVLPNALPSALAAFANSLAYFVTGAFFVEAVFGIPGLGSLAQEALRNKDVAVLAGICLLFAVVVLFISFTLDILLRWLNPRVARAMDYI